MKILSAASKTSKKETYNKEDKELASVFRVVKDNHPVKRISSTKVEFSGKKKRYDKEPVVDLS